MLPEAKVWGRVKQATHIVYCVQHSSTQNCVKTVTDVLQCTFDVMALTLATYNSTQRIIILPIVSARNGNLEMPAHFVKVKQEYYVRKMEKINGYFILIIAGMKFRNKKQFRYGVPAYTGPLRALCIVI
jgi:hypothetical protein